MNVKKLLIAAAFVSICGFTVAAKPKAAYQVTVQDELKLDGKNKKIGYQLVENGEKIVFIFDAKSNGISRVNYAYVEGSFNGWKKKDGKWQLAKEKDGLFILYADISDVKIPGNSGFPEFKFFVKYDVEYTETVCGQVLTRYRQEEKELPALKAVPGYQMATNNLILLPTDDANYIIENNKIANTVKKLKDFNLDNPEDVATISNVRLVPGTTKLYRGYHPYKMSRQEFNTEETRIRLVNKQLKDYGVKALITLSGDESLSKAEQLSVYVTDIRTAGNQFFANTHYNTVYYQSTSKEFGTMMGDIIRFIGTHEGPYYVHCRLGTDRTGVVSATLAALCGAGWEDIAADYQKTNNMGIKEFRDYRLLQYSFEQILGHSIADTENLQQEMIDYFTGRKFATREEIDTLISKLR